MSECCDLGWLSSEHGRDKVWRLVGAAMAEAEAAADALGLAPAELARLAAEVLEDEADSVEADLADDLAAVEAKAAEVNRIAAKLSLAVEAPRKSEERR